MSTDSDTPVIVVQQQGSRDSPGVESEDDEVFVNRGALMMDPFITRRSHKRHYSSESSLDRSESFLKLVKTIQFVKKWAARVDQPLEHCDSAIDQARPSRQSNVSNELEEDSERHEQLTKQLQQKIVWNPNGNWLYYWMGIVSLAVIYNAVIIIVRWTFDQFHEILLPLWLLLDYTADLIYIMDMGVQGTTSLLYQGLMVTNLKQLARHYIKSTWFIVDIVSILPTDLLYILPWIGVNRTIVRINRLLRLHRVVKFLERTESQTNYPNFLRVLQLVLLLTVLIHWNGCFYFLLSEHLGFGSDSWVYPAIIDKNGNFTEHASLTRQYLFSFYWSTLTLTTIGELPGPVRNEEYAFVIFDFLAGVLIFATIVGMVGGIVTNMNMRRTEFQGNLDNLKQYMGYRRVGKDLQDRVIQWFDYQWTSNKTLNEEKTLSSLPNKLQAEIAIHVHFETLRQVKIFEECEAGLLEELVLKLKPQVYSPGDYVCRKGDVGREMYIIKHGRLEVVGDDETTVYATLTDGSYFGEISILNLGGSGNRRTANVRSVGYSELFCLSKADLLETLSEYPETKALLEERGNRTLMKDGMLEEGKEDREAIRTGDSGRGGSPVHGELEGKVEQLECNLEQLQGRFTRLLGEYNTAQMKLKQRIYALETKVKF